jgi:hypothetical protein
LLEAGATNAPAELDLTACVPRQSQQEAKFSGLGELDVAIRAAKYAAD